MSNGDKKFIYSRDILGRNIPVWSRKIVTNQAANKLQYICDTDCKVVSWTSDIHGENESYSWGPSSNIIIAHYRLLVVL